MTARSTIEWALDELDATREHCTNWAWSVALSDWDEAREYADWYVTTFDCDDPISHTTAWEQFQHARDTVDNIDRLAWAMERADAEDHGYPLGSEVSDDR